MNSKVTELRNKILDTASLVTKTNSNSKVADTENKEPGISDLIKKTDFDKKLRSINNQLSTIKIKQVLVCTTFLMVFSKGYLVFRPFWDTLSLHNINYAKITARKSYQVILILHLK